MPAHISSINHGVYQKGGQSLLWDGCRFTKKNNLTMEPATGDATRDHVLLGSLHLAQTNGHNHAVNPATTQVEEVKSKLRKRAIPETTCPTSEPV